MKTYPLLAARIFNVPLLIHPQRLDAIIAGIGPRLLGLSLDKLGAELAGGTVQASAQPEMFATTTATSICEDGGYCIADGVAVVSMIGPLVHRSRMQADCSMLWGYSDFLGRIEHAVKNPDVTAIVIMADTPGGEAQGAFECAQRLFDLRGQKPIRCVADGMLASAGYLIGSAADEVITTKTGYSGSIGVVMRHVDFSKGLADDGIAVTHVYAGAHKIDGNQFEPLPDSVRADMQAEVDDLYQMFVSAVSLHRGLTPEAVRGTEARVYRGVSAVAAGLADRIGTVDGVIAELANATSTRFVSLPPATPDNVGAPAMTGTTQPTAATPATAADLDRARAEGHAAGIADERARVSAIQSHVDAAANPGIAQMCISQGLSADQAGAILSAAPKPQAAALAPANPLAAAMAAIGNPDVKPDAASATSADAQAAAVAGIVAVSTRKRAA